VKVVRAYLDSPTRKKFPVGKIAGPNSHSYNGSSVLHVLIEHLESVDGRTVKSWRLACKPKTTGVYSYMGFRQVIGCTVCKSARISGHDADADSSGAGTGGAA
jgi:hypothetical protein